jgi:phosphatidylglycerophosphate synthase
MITFPNLLSFLRIPLALAFLQANVALRIIAILGSMLTDFLDGFLARRYNMCSRVGTTLDPMSDKFFVFAAITALFHEGQLSWVAAISMMGRDFAVILFGLYLILTRQWDDYQFRAIWCGKITTALQLSVLFALTLHLGVPDAIYACFVVLGLLALVELYLVERIRRTSIK